MKSAVTPEEIFANMYTDNAPVIIDVRRLAAFEQSERIIPTACWRDHRTAGEWADALPAQKDVVVYCVHGQQVSQAACALLQNRGVNAYYLAGGFDAWENAGGLTLSRGAVTAHQGKHWVTRENPKINRIACPWLIKRFIDPGAAFHYVETGWVEAVAAEMDAVVFDADGATFSHDGELCGFDAFIRHFEMRDAALDQMATIIRGADAAHSDPAPQAAGLAALSSGLSALYKNDLERLDKGLIFYDALYGWCRNASHELHRSIDKTV